MTPVSVNAVAPSQLLIIELQTRSAAESDAANQEFVEIYNISEDVIDLSLWKLEYKSATGSSWSTKVVLEGSLQPKGRHLLASNGYLSSVANQTFSPGFADSAGHIRLAEKDNTTGLFVERDTLGWGITANAAETLPAQELSAGKSLQRRLNEAAVYVDTDNNQLDFALNAVPTPEAFNPEPVPTPVPETPPEPELTSPTDPPISNETPPETPPDSDGQPAPVVDETPPPETIPEVIVTLLPLQITELLPNPAAPQTDNADEFIELFNPNSTPVDATGYVVKTGNTLSYSYTVEGIIPPNGFLVLTSAETPLSLANSGGKARLIAPDGSIVAETVAYEEAPEGQSWALGTAGWSWTTTATLGQVNIMTVPVMAPVVPKTTAVPKATTKKTTTKAAAPKVKAATASTKTTKATSAPKTAKKAATTNVAANSADFEPEEVPPAIHPLVLAGVSAAALVYAGYEYRQDVANRIYQFRLHRAARRASRSQSDGE